VRKVIVKTSGTCEPEKRGDIKVLPVVHVIYSITNRATFLD